VSGPELSALRAGAHRRPYATLLAKGEDRRQLILAVAERLLARKGWRNTSLAQIAKEAGVTPAGLLHHFESKEQLLNAVLDARDADDDAHADYRRGDLITELSRVPERFERAPELIGTFTVLLVENIAPDAPLQRPHSQAVFATRSTSSRTSSSAVRAMDSSGRISTRPARPWKYSPSSTEWRPYGCSILQYR